MSQQKRVRKTRKEQEKGEVLEQPLEEPPVRSQSAQLQIIFQDSRENPNEERSERPHVQETIVEEALEETILMEKSNLETVLEEAELSSVLLMEKPLDDTEVKFIREKIGQKALDEYEDGDVPEENELIVPFENPTDAELVALKRELTAKIFKGVKRVDRTYVMCLTCKEKVKYPLIGNKGTGNVTAHPCMRILYPRGTGQQQVIGSDGKIKSNVEPVSPARHSILTRLISKVICEDSRPFRLVQTKAWKVFIKEGIPGYSLPHPDTFRNKMEKEYLPTVEKGLKSILEKQKHYAFTSDLWSSIAGDKYITFTIHYIQDFQLISRVLEAIDVPTISVTNVEINKMTENLFKKYNLTKEKAVAFTLDGGGNLHNGVNEYGVKSKRCISHLLHNAVTSAMEWAADIISIVKEIYGYFAGSTKAMTALKNLQRNEAKIFGFQEISYKMVNEVKTRWNSVLALLHSYIQIWDCVQEVICHMQQTHLEIEQCDHHFIYYLCDILKPCQMLSDEMSASEHVTFSSVLPAIMATRQLISRTQMNETQISVGLTQKCALIKEKLLYYYDHYFSDIILDSD